MGRFTVTVSLLIAVAAWNFPQFQQWNQHGRSGVSLSQRNRQDCEYKPEKAVAIDHVATQLDRDNDLTTNCD